jgi:hypothetical protein
MAAMDTDTDMDMEYLTTPYDPFPHIEYCNNSFLTDEETCWFVHIDLPFFIKVISMGFIVLFGLIGNSVLALAILLSERLRSKSVNFLIVFLCISNFLSLLLAPFIVVDSVTEFYVLGEFLCKTQQGIQIFFFVVPMLTLLLISIDRSVLPCEQPILKIPLHSGISPSATLSDTRTGTGRSCLPAPSPSWWAGAPPHMWSTTRRSRCWSGPS